MFIYDFVSAGLVYSCVCRLIVKEMSHPDAQSKSIGINKNNTISYNIIRHNIMKYCQIRYIQYIR